jgi:hypothetical protein
MASVPSASSRRCPPVRFRRPGSGVRPSDVRPVRCPVTGFVRTRPSGPIRRWRLGTGPMRHGNPHHGNGSRSRWAAASSSGSGRRPSRPGRGRRRRGHPWSAGRSVADPGRVGCGRRPRVTLASRAGQAGVRSARRRRRGCGHGRRPQREVAAPAARLPSPGWVGHHGGWLWWRLPPGWTGPEGPMGVPAGMGVRPQRGPGWQRVLPACCRQRCDLRRWLVGLPGLEPGTSSLSAKCREPLCNPAFPQVAANRRGRSSAFLHPR